jgi:hypothetical protein
MDNYDTYVQNLIFNDQFKTARTCIVDEWDGDVRVCETCRREIAENGIYICDHCLDLYCILCVEEGSVCEVDDKIHTFCTQECMHDFVEESDLEIYMTCEICQRDFPEAHIQRIDREIGTVCLPCLISTGW